MKMPDIGLVHFIGIGGIGMSGIAEVLHNLGYHVQGSDQSDSANVQRLRAKGITCFVGHREENLGDAEVVVVSTAIKANNPELVAARHKLLPIVRRAEMLAELRGLIDGLGAPWQSLVARLLLKGLSHKEIATVRGASEATARQHATAVYKKANLAGRAELAAFFLEDLLLPRKQLTK